MTNPHVIYSLELLFPTESTTLYFAISEAMGAKELVATVRCFDPSGSLIEKIESLPFSKSLESQFLYLRPNEESTGNWLEVPLVAGPPIKHIRVEIIPWNKTFDSEVKDVVFGVWAGASATDGDKEYPVNFVSIRGAK